MSTMRRVSKKIKLAKLHVMKGCPTCGTLLIFKDLKKAFKGEIQFTEEEVFKSLKQINAFHLSKAEESKYTFGDGKEKQVILSCRH